MEWGSAAAHKFITNVGLITSNGPHGENIMSAEWTHHISYSPGMIAVCIRPGKATAENILSTKEFGVNLASIEQGEAVSVSGGHSGKVMDKIAALKELGIGFTKGSKINVPMVKEAALQLECKLAHEMQLGSHILFVGEIISVKVTEKEPLALYKGRYWKMDTPLDKPAKERREAVQAIVSTHARK